MGSPVETVDNKLARVPDIGLAKRGDPFIQEWMRRINDLITLIEQTTPNQERVVIERRGEDGKPSYKIGKVSLVKKTIFGYQWDVIEYLAKTQGIPIEKAREMVFREFKNNEPSVPQK